MNTTFNLFQLSQHNEAQLALLSAQKKADLAELAERMKFEREQRFLQMQEPFVDRVIGTAFVKMEEIKTQAKMIDCPKERHFFHLKTEDDIELYKRTKDSICTKMKEIFGQECHVYLSSKESKDWIREKSYFAIDDDSCQLRLNYKPYLFVTWDGSKKADEAIRKTKDCGQFKRDTGYWSP